MYLFIFADNSVCQCNDNLSVADLIAVKEGVLQIVKIVEETALEIVIEDDKLKLVPLKEGNIIQCKEGRLHHP